jgi:hypothetical protein
MQSKSSKKSADSAGIKSRETISAADKVPMGLKVAGGEVDVSIPKKVEIHLDATESSVNHYLFIKEAGTKSVKSWLDKKQKGVTIEKVLFSVDGYNASGKKVILNLWDELDSKKANFFVKFFR